MTQYSRRNRQPLDSQAFAAVLLAMFICMILLVVESVMVEMPAETPTIAAAPSQQQCARL